MKICGMKKSGSDHPISTVSVAGIAKRHVLPRCHQKKKKAGAKRIGMIFTLQARPRKRPESSGFSTAQAMPASRIPKATSESTFP